MGRPVAVPGARPPSGLGEGSRASGASGRGPGSDRGCARGLAGAPGFLGAGPLPPPPGRDAASSFPPASARPGPGALSLHLSPRGAGVVVGGRLGRRVPGGVSGPGRGLAPGASGSPRAPPGPASRARPDPPRLRSGQGGGGEPPGTERRPAGRPGAGGAGVPRGFRGAGGGGVGTRVPAPRPPTPLGAQSGIRQPAERGWCKAVAATSFPPRGPGLPTKRCPPRPIVAPGRSRCQGTGSERARAAFCKLKGFQDAAHRPPPPRPQDAPASQFGPQVWLRGPPSPPTPLEGKKREGGWQPEPGA